MPLAGIRKLAAEMGQELPELSVAVRSGDTPASERQAMLRKAPHILITTPESLYILLTSPSGRELFRDVRTVIVDEIHTLAGSKRGVHLALSLERLQQLARQPIQRIGLSATIRPLDEVARYLGGSSWQGEGEQRALTPRPVTIVDAGYRKELDLLVETVVDDFRALAGDSVWPLIVPAGGGSHPPAPHHPHLRQQPPPGRARRRLDQRADGGRGARQAASEPRP